MCKLFFFKSIVSCTITLLIISCSKKSSDTPSPAPTETSIQAAREVPVSIKDNQAPGSGDGTVRTAPTSINVDGISVVVQSPDDQFKTSMTSTGSSNLDQILGANSQLRTEGPTNDIGWEINGVKVNGLKDDTSSLYNDWYLFNVKQPGIYYVFHGGPNSGGPGLLKNWAWGTYAVDKELKYIAFDLDSNNVPSSVWALQYLNKGIMVMKTKVRVKGGFIPITLKFDAGDFSEDKALNGIIKPNLLDMQLAMPDGVKKASWKLIGESINGQLDSANCTPPLLDFSLGFLLTGNGLLPCTQGSFTSTGNSYFATDSVNGAKRIRMYYESLTFNGQTYNDAIIEGSLLFTYGQLNITYNTFPVSGYDYRTFVFAPTK